ncbi:MAG: hypothetical protein Q4A92_01300 [Corynebacterium sp.]|nr:hypothetical protein [Corynebacterium sp.]
MPNICFHVLVPDAEVTNLGLRFQQLSKKLIDAAVATDFSIRHCAVECQEEDQLRQVYRDEHDDQDLANASVYCFEITPTGLQRSLNETAMTFARLLTPPVELPSEAAFLDNEQAYEVPATYPWTVYVYP